VLTAAIMLGAAAGDRGCAVALVMAVVMVMALEVR
jgi:hypothetical protein